MFKEHFKYYKSKKDVPNFEKVLDLHCKQSEFNETQMKQIYLKNYERNFTLNPPEMWEVYDFSNKPGLIYIRNPFTAIGQRYWTVRCLRDYSKKSNKRNIDSFNYNIPDNKEWWDLAQNDKNILNKLRWATLGYHHNWDTKVYTENNKGEFPNDLANLTETIAGNLGYTDFVAEAAIINYYHMDSTLSGHTDHSEKNLTAALFSFSFGETAIFLLGGKTLEEEPLAIFLKSGDIIVMSEESRLCYHGVPRILKTSEKSWNTIQMESKNFDSNDIIKICNDEKLWQPYGDYLDNCRVNMNVRQVLNKNENSLNDNL